MNHKNKNKLFLRHKIENISIPKLCEEKKYISIQDTLKLKRQILLIESEEDLKLNTTSKKPLCILKQPKEENKERFATNLPLPKFLQEAKQLNNLNSLQLNQQYVHLNQQVQRWKTISEDLRIKSQSMDLVCLNLFKQSQKLACDILFQNKAQQNKDPVIIKLNPDEIQEPVFSFQQIKINRSNLLLQKQKNMMPKKSREIYNFNSLVSNYTQKGQKSLLVHSLRINQFFQIDFGQQLPQVSFAAPSFALSECNVKIQKERTNKQKKSLLDYFQKVKAKKLKLMAFLQKCNYKERQFAEYKQFNEDLICLSRLSDFKRIRIQKPCTLKSQLHSSLKVETCFFDQKQEDIEQILQPIKSCPSYQIKQQYDTCLQSKFERIPRCIFQYISKKKQIENDERRLIFPSSHYRSPKQTAQLLLKYCKNSINKLSVVVFDANNCISSNPKTSAPQNKIGMSEAFNLLLHLSNDGVCSLQNNQGQVLITMNRR